MRSQLNNFEYFKSFMTEIQTIIDGSET